MKTQKNLDEQHKEATTSPNLFFRELEIEFLLHELKDPLSIIETGMRSLLERREKYGPLSVRQEKTLKRTLRNTKKVREMLNGLLEIGRSEAGQFVCCRFQPVKAVYVVLMDTLEMLSGISPDHFKKHSEEREARQFFSKHGIFLNIVPQIVETEMFQDEIKFRQIVGNLIKNALHHRKERIEVTMKKETNNFVIDVTDDGPGIDPEHHQTIFQRYTQVKNSSESTRQGHGLGLAGALILAKGLGGDIEIKSEKGKGATFRLILPIMLERQPV